MEASLNSNHGVWTRRRRQFVTWVVTVTFTVTTAVPTSQMSADPVALPTITTPGFNETDLDSIFGQAWGASSTAEWQSVVASGLYTLSASWEAAVDTAIQNEVLAVTNSDAFNSVAEYQDYLRKELEIQKVKARADWEAAALAAVANERSAYLTATDAQRDAAAAEAAGNVPAATSGSGSANQGYAEWERKMQEQANAGIADLGEALQNLENDYRDTLAGLAAKEAEFAQSLAQIEAYEKTVRDGIDVAVQNMEALLAGNGMFYSSPGVLNQAGLDFQAFINQLKTDLANNVPLSDLTLTMTTELESKKLVEETTVTYYNSIKQGTIPVDTWENGNNHTIDWRLNPLVNTVALYMESGGANYVPLLNQLSAMYGKTFVSINGGGMDICADSTAAHYTVNIIQIATARTGECFSAHGNSAFTFDAAGCGGIGGVPICLWNFNAPFGVDGWAEQRMRVTVSGNWYDAAAAANEVTHQSYVDTLDPITLDWRNNLLPAIQDWEAQVAQYEQNYANFQTEAVGIRASATAAYEAGRDELLARRNAYAAQMDSVYRQGRQQWAALISAEEQARNDGTDAAVDDRIRNLQRQLEASTDLALDRIERQLNTSNLTASAISAQMQDAQRRLDSITTDFNRAGGGVDSSTLENLLQSFYKATTGVKNLSYAQAMHERAQDARDSAIERIADHVRSQDGEISFMMNRERFEEEKRLAELAQLRDGEVEGELKYYTAFDQAEFDRLQDVLQTKMAEERKKHKDEGFEVVVDPKTGAVTMKRQIASGDAVYNGGAATDRDSYGREMEDQTVTILPPDALELVSGGDVFEAWDFGNVGSDFSQEFQEYNDNLQDKMQSVQEQINAANKMARENEKAFQQNVSFHVEQAKLIESLAKAMLGGASFGQALASEMRSHAGQVLGEAWGIPPSIISAILGGAKPHEAVGSYIEGQVMSAIDQALGLPPGTMSMFSADQKAKKAAKKAKQQAVVSGAIMVVGAIAAPFTAGASLAIAGAVAGAYQSVNNGGGLQGALVGAVGGIANGFVQMATGGAVSVGLSYSPDNGFGGSVGVGYGPATVTVSHSEHGGTGVSAGIGYGGFQAGVSYHTEDGFGASVGYGHDFGSFGINYSENEGLSAGLSLGDDDEGLNLNYSDSGGFSAGYTNGGLDLSYNEEDGFGASYSWGDDDSAALELNYGDGGLTAGFSGYGFEANYNNGDWGLSADVGELADAAGFDTDFLGEDFGGTIGYTSGEGLTAGLGSEYGNLNYSQAGGLGIDLNTISFGGIDLDAGWNSNTGFNVGASGYGLDAGYGPGGLSLTGDVGTLASQFGIDAGNLGGSGFGVDGQIDFMGGGFTGTVQGNGFDANIDGSNVSGTFSGSFAGVETDLAYDPENGFTGSASGYGLNANYGEGGLSLTGDVNELASQFGVDASDLGGSGFGVDGEIDFTGGQFTGNVQGNGFDVDVDGDQVDGSFAGSYGGLDLGVGYDSENGFSGALSGGGFDLAEYNEQDGFSSPYLDSVEDQWEDLKDWAQSPERWGEDPPLGEDTPIGQIGEVVGVLGGAAGQAGEDLSNWWEENFGGDDEEDSGVAGGEEWPDGERPDGNENGESEEGGIAIGPGGEGEPTAGQGSGEVVAERQEDLPDMKVYIAPPDAMQDTLPDFEEWELKGTFRANTTAFPSAEDLRRQKKVEGYFAKLLLNQYPNDFSSADNLAAEIEWQGDKTICAKNKNICFDAGDVLRWNVTYETKRADDALQSSAKSMLSTHAANVAANEDVDLDENDPRDRIEMRVAEVSAEYLENRQDWQERWDRRDPADLKARKALLAERAAMEAEQREDLEYQIDRLRGFDRDVPSVIRMQDGTLHYGAIEGQDRDTIRLAMPGGKRITIDKHDIRRVVYVGEVNERGEEIQINERGGPSYSSVRADLESINGLNPSLLPAMDQDLSDIFAKIKAENGGDVAKVALEKIVGRLNGMVGADATVHGSGYVGDGNSGRGNIMVGSGPDGLDVESKNFTYEVVEEAPTNLPPGSEVISMQVPVTKTNSQGEPYQTTEQRYVVISTREGGKPNLYVSMQARDHTLDEGANIYPSTWMEVLKIDQTDRTTVFGGNNNSLPILRPGLEVAHDLNPDELRQLMMHAYGDLGPDGRPVPAPTFTEDHSDLDSRWVPGAPIVRTYKRDGHKASQQNFWGGSTYGQDSSALRNNVRDHALDPDMSRREAGDLVHNLVPGWVGVEGGAPIRLQDTSVVWRLLCRNGGQGSSLCQDEQVNERDGGAIAVDGPYDVNPWAEDKSVLIKAYDRNSNMSLMEVSVAERGYVETGPDGNPQYTDKLLAQVFGTENFRETFNAGNPLSAPWDPDLKMSKCPGPGSEMTVCVSYCQLNPRPRRGINCGSGGYEDQRMSLQEWGEYWLANTDAGKAFADRQAAASNEKRRQRLAALEARRGELAGENEALRLDRSNSTEAERIAASEDVLGGAGADDTVMGYVYQALEAGRERFTKLGGDAGKIGDAASAFLDNPGVDQFYDLMATISEFGENPEVMVALNFLPVLPRLVSIADGVKAYRDGDWWGLANAALGTFAGIRSGKITNNVASGGDDIIRGADDAVEGIDGIFAAGRRKAREISQEIREKIAQVRARMEKVKRSRKDNPLKEVPGEPDPIKQGMSAEQVGKLMSERKNAQLFADRGYEIRFNQDKLGTKKPDFFMEGHYYDNYMPNSKTSAQGIVDGIAGKVGSKQTGDKGRIVLDLSDNDVDLDKLREALVRDMTTDGSSNSDLVKLFVVRDGQIFDIFD